MQFIMNSLISYLLLLSTTFLLTSADGAIRETCDPHSALYRIAYPVDCVFLARLIRSRGNTPLTFTEVYPAERPPPQVVALPYLEKYISCAMTITLIRGPDVSTWYRIGEELISIYNDCQTGVHGFGGNAIFGNRHGLFIHLTSSTLLAESQVNETAAAVTRSSDASASSSAISRESTRIADTSAPSPVMIEAMR